MQKIMFNDALGLTQAVLDGRKKITRRICKYDIPSDEWEIGFPVFDSNDFNDDGECTSPLNYAFGWRNKKTGEEIKWNIPRYKVGEVVAIAQSYKDIMSEKQFGEVWSIVNDITKEMAGYNNKMFVKSDLMPHQIKITNIRIERLQDISDEDCLLEGIHKGKVGNENHWMDAYYTHKSSIEPHCKPRGAFAALIDNLNGKGTWESNPYFFVHEFELIK